MKPIVVAKKQQQFLIDNYSLGGATAVYCPNKDKKGFSDIVVVADAFDGSDSSAGTFLWRYDSVNKQWQAPVTIEKSFCCDLNGSMIKCGYGGVCVDEEHKVMIFLSNDTFWDKGDFESIKRCRKLYYRLSYDNGYTWTDKKYIIQEGKDKLGKSFNSTHFLENVTYGVNSAAFVGNSMLPTDDGALLTGVHIQDVDDKGNLIEPSGFMFLYSVALRAMWQENLQDYCWDLSNSVKIGEKLSTRGLFEPAFARLKNNMYIMIMRASNYGQEEMLCTKFYAVSLDNGKSWSQPERLAYNDGTIMFSSASIPKLIRHSNGKLYYVGIINSENPQGNLPRYPLCIAQIDDEKLCVIKESVTVIDTKPSVENTDEKYLFDLSNHCVFEDRDTKELVVIAPYREDLKKYQSGLNMYRVKVAE